MNHQQILCSASEQGRKWESEIPTFPLSILTMADRFALSSFEFFMRHIRARFPFHAGIASMTDVPVQILSGPACFHLKLVKGQRE